MIAMARIIARRSVTGKDREKDRTGKDRKLSQRNLSTILYQSVISKSHLKAFAKQANVRGASNMKITGISLTHIQPRAAFLTMTTNVGIIGYGEAVLEGRGRTVETAVKELAEYLLGKDPRQIEHHWQAMYRGTFYRGGPVLVSAISGVEQAMWDIMGKWLNVPVYQLLGGAVRQRIRTYRQVHGTKEQLRTVCQEAVAQGYTMVKTSLDEYAQVTETQSWVRRQVERAEVIREVLGPDRDFAIDFHGRVHPALAIRLAKEIEHLFPMFIEEPCLPENVDSLVLIARSTTVPIATGERLFTKWGFREVLEKQAAAIIQPDLAHCGGILEAKKIAAMAESYFVGVAPHNAIGAVNLAASLQLDAMIPNFIAQEQVFLGEGFLKEPFVLKDGYIDLPTKPGLGIELDEAGVAALSYSGDHQMPFAVHDDDGSVADW